MAGTPWLYVFLFDEAFWFSKNHIELYTYMYLSFVRDL